MKKYLCPYCGVALKHDEAYPHTQYKCPKKNKR